MKVSELANKVSELKTEMDGKFAAVDTHFERVDRVLEDLRKLVKSEGETTRRHFDVVAEKMVSGTSRWTGP